MPAAAVDLARFERETGREQPRNQVVNPQLKAVEYPDVRLVAVDGRLQLELEPTLTAQAAVETVNWVLSLVALFRPTAIGFNIVARRLAAPCRYPWT
jgi:hypothetical protein